MAGKTVEKTEHFYEIVMETTAKQARAFLAGLMIGCRKDCPVWLNHESGIYHEGFAEKLAETTHLRPKDCHFITNEALRDMLKKYSKRILNEGGIKLVSARKIRTARLSFKFQTYALRYGTEIMDLLNNLPEGLELKKYKSDEKVEPRAAGLETYASAHDYDLSGKGEIVGRIDKLVEIRDRMHQQPLFKLKKIKLSLA